jgi:ubiquinone/menaquinone biosynthesis C-methylase UbiE
MRFDGVEHSYVQQAENELQISLPSCYTSPDSVDHWRHARMLRSVLPLLEAFPQATWATIGDGRYGSDAFFLQRHGANVLATSLTDSNLRIAQERGYIDKFQAENAERLSFQDDSFDFILCKESYHHFPRPAIAFYEMVRVARMGVILIEPIEGSWRLLDWSKDIVKRVLRGDRTPQFESSGNFLYRANVREIEKMMTAIAGAAVAVKPFNDFYHPWLARQSSTGTTFGLLATKAGIALQNALCRARLMNYGLGVIVVLRFNPPDSVEKVLQDRGFRVTHLPRNPYHTSE